MARSVYRRVMGWKAEVRFPAEPRKFVFFTVSKTTLGPTPPIKCVPGAHSLGLEQLGHEADHTLPSSVEI
jgi:hypothetical protein